MNVFYISFFIFIWIECVLDNYNINNLLILNSKKRFSAKQVLQSNYLKEFYGDDPINLDKLISPIDGNELNGPIDENKFQNIFDLLKKKLNE